MIKAFFCEPLFLPSLSFFRALMQSELWVVLDHVQFTPRSDNNQCRVKTSQGIQVLKVAVKHPCSKPICQMMINNYLPWKKIFLSIIERSYEKAPYYSVYIDDLKSFIEGPCMMLETLNMQTTLWIARLLGIHPNLLYTRSLYVTYSKSKTIKALCQKLNAEPIKQKSKNLSVLNALFTQGAEKIRNDLIERL